MKKIVTFAGIAILFALLSAPSFVKADSLYHPIGSAYCRRSDSHSWGTYTIYCAVDPLYLSVSNYRLYGKLSMNTSSSYQIYSEFEGGSLAGVSTLNLQAVFIPTLEGTYNYNSAMGVFSAVNNISDYNQLVPEGGRLPEPTWLDNLWSEFYDFLEFQLGLDPFDGGIWEFFHNFLNSDEPTEYNIVFPTNTPTPTPTPRPTPIPVQTIYVPDGNGSYTIVYQYPDSNGNITQSPYNPNVEVNVDVDCDCNNSNNYNPQDPMYYPFDGLTWASIDGDLSDTPAMSAGQSLDIIKAEVDSYDEPIKVVSNSFGALPSKWLGLVGLLGACLIVAGLIRTFLGG